MPNHAIPGHFRLHRIKTNRNPVYFSVHLAICMTICGAYAIRPYTGTRKNDDYFIPRIKTNRNPDKFSSGRVGAYCIRPTDEHVRGRTNPIPIRFLIYRLKTNQNPVYFPFHLAIRMVVCGAYAVTPYTDNKNLVYFLILPTICMAVCGAYCIRPTDGHARGRSKLIPIRFLILRIKTNQNPDKFSFDRVGAYCIRPIDGHGSGRMKLIPIRFLIHRVKTNRNPVHFFVHLAICMTICGAYAIRPYTGTRKNGDSFIPRMKRDLILIRFSNPRPKMNLKSIGFFNPGPKGMAVPGA